MNEQTARNFFETLAMIISMREQAKVTLKSVTPVEKCA